MAGKSGLLAVLGRGPPGKVLQKVNRLHHTEPYSSVVYHVFWGLVLTVAMPLAGMALLCKGVFELMQTLRDPPVKLKPNAPTEEGDDFETVEYAVFITGCDSGIGKETALRLMAEGFVVFCTCLKQESLQTFRLDKNAIPLVVDVTDDSQVDQAAATVRKWLDDTGSNGKKTKRYLRALVNNAGIGIGGLIDWLSMEHYHACMEVNCFGVIRTTKAFLPLFKRQVLDRSYDRGQIMNIVSSAGMVPSAEGLFSAYEVSKNAAYAFSDGLRYELKSLGINVVTVCPTFHRTPLLADSLQENVAEEYWKKMSADTQKEYGRDFLATWTGKMQQRMTAALWDVGPLVDIMVDTIETDDPPAELIVGTDGKLITPLLRMMPQWLRHAIFDATSPTLVPAFLQEKEP